MRRAIFCAFAAMCAVGVVVLLRVIGQEISDGESLIYIGLAIIYAEILQ